MIFNDFVEYDEWFDDAWNVMILFFKLYDMLAWMRECMSGICSIFHFFINLRNVGGVMHMQTLWIIDDVWHAMIFFLNLVDAWMHGCMGEFYFIKKDELLMYAWLGMMYEFFFCIFLKTIFELILISLLFLIHGVILLWFFFTFLNHFLGLINLLTNTFLIISLKHYLNDMHEIVPRAWKGLDEVMKIN